MIKIFKNVKRCKIVSFPAEVIENIEEIIVLLNENYGADRDVDNDLGGYVLLADSIVDIEALKEDKLQGLAAEYTDEIICSGGVKYTSSLFLLSSDYSVVVIAEEKLSKILLEE